MEPVSVSSLASNLPVVKENHKKNNTSSLSYEFRTSKFPLSNLNIELERQCILADIYQNIDKLRYKEKYFPPTKVVWKKNKNNKVEIKTVSMNMKAVINGDLHNSVCKECLLTKCICKVIDKFGEYTRKKIMEKARTDEAVKKNKCGGRETVRLQSVPIRPNWLVEKTEKRRTRRRKIYANDYQLLPEKVLSVSPKILYMKVLDEDEDNDYD